MKKVLQILSAILICVLLSFPANAENFKGQDGWRVTFSSEGAVESNFKSEDYNDPVSGLQPGDDIIFEIALENLNAEATDWYVENDILHSLEDESLNKQIGGGAYTYILRYYDADGAEHTLYSSEALGGDDKTDNVEGLRKASGALENYFYLDRLGSGERARVTIYVALDGETLGNDYQKTLADLSMNFAVALGMNEAQPSGPSGNDNPGDSPNGSRNDSPETPGRNTTIVKTGDESHTFLFFFIMVVSGLLILFVAFVLFRMGRKKKGRSL